MYIKKRGKAKAAKAAEGGRGDDAAAGGGGAAAGSGNVMTHDDDFDHRLGNYQLMEGIGKGGYGVVYRGLNIERGMTVAVKRINLQGIPQEELESIEVRGSAAMPAADLNHEGEKEQQERMHCACEQETGHAVAASSISLTVRPLRVAFVVLLFLSFLSLSLSVVPPFSRWRFVCYRIWITPTS